MALTNEDFIGDLQILIDGGVVHHKTRDALVRRGLAKVLRDGTVRVTAKGTRLARKGA